MKYVIIGGVAAGMSAAARLRRICDDAQIIVFEKGEYISYANCGLPYYIGGTIAEREKLLVQTVRSVNRRFNIDIRIKSEIIEIDPAKKVVKVKDYVSQKEYFESYDKLLLTPGAEPFVPDIPGVKSNKIFTLRTINDTDKIKSFIDKNSIKRALVVGGGFIGLEVAENLHKIGAFVTIVELLNQLMPPLDFEMAAIIHNHLKSKGIEFYLNNTISSFTEDNSKIRAELKNGKIINADIVILSIGVRPDISLAQKAGLKIGERGGIIVNEYMQTNNPDIYAAGDAVEIINGVTGKNAVIPLAGPANKQGRLAAENMVFGNSVKYKNTYGSSIAKIFDLTVAVTGANERTLQKDNIPYLYTLIHPASHATYYPGGLQMSLKVIFSQKDGKILGAQCVGYDGVDKRIDVITAIMQKNGTIYDLKEFEQAYAPPYSSAKDPVNMAGFTAENILRGMVVPVYWKDIDRIDTNKTLLLDVRTQEEFKSGTIKGAINIPVDEIRKKLSELPSDKEIVVFCRVGLRGYIAARILAQNGFKNVKNLVGGYITYSFATSKQDNPDKFDESYDIGLSSNNSNISNSSSYKIIKVDACGLQCPGPIIKLKSEMDKLSEGEKIEIIATDPGFYNDIVSWAKATDNKVLSLNMDKGVVTAVIEKGKGASNIQQERKLENDKTIIVFDNNLDRVIASFIIANGALAMGRKVTMFFTFWGLSVLRKKKGDKVKKNIIEKMFGWMLPKGSTDLKLSQMNMGGLGTQMIRWLMKKKNVGSLEEMIETAIKNGARIVACQMSMDLMGIKKEELIEGVEIGGVASYLEASEHADNNLFI